MATVKVGDSVRIVSGTFGENGGNHHFPIGSIVRIVEVLFGEFILCEGESENGKIISQTIWDIHYELVSESKTTVDCDNSNDRNKQLYGI